MEQNNMLNEVPLNIIENLDELEIKFIGVLIKKSNSEDIDTIEIKINQLSRLELENRTAIAQLKGERLSMWFYNKEFTIRGIPPIFRKLNLVDSKIPRCDFVWYDLEWLHKKYSNHKPEAKRWSKIFELKNFSHSTAGLIFKELRAEMWRNVKALALRSEWQNELIILKKYDFVKIWNRLNINKDWVLQSLRANHFARNPKMGFEQANITIKRRHEIWICATLCERSPQQTAKYYKALTGVEITRQLAAKIIEEVKSDCPDAFVKKFYAENQDL